MSYATDILRRRQEAATAFRPRYNPMESVLSALSKIDEETKDAAFKQAREERDIEKYGLEKERILAETEKLKQDRSASEEALAEQRKAWAEAARQRAGEFQARTAEKQAEMRAEEEENARKAVVEKAYGMMRGAGLPGPGATPVSKADLEELGATVGMTGDEVLAGVEEIEAERAKMGAGLGLVEAKKETEQERAAALRRKGLGGGGKAGKATTSEEAARKGRMAALEERKAAADTARAEEKLARDRMAAGSNGVFQLTESQRNKLQDRRTAVLDRATAAKGIRDLIAKYPDMDKYVGSIDQYISSVRSKLGSSAAAEILAALGRASDEYRTAVTGAAASDKEREMLESRVPNAGDSVAAILGKLAVDDEYFKNKFAIVDAQLQANDIRGADALLGITGVAPMETAAPAAPKKAPSKAVQDDIDQFGLED